MTTHTSTLFINSGTCVCGHSWEDHHLSVICNSDAYKAIEAFIKTNFPDRQYPMYIPGECEHFGFNEYGGMKPVDGDNMDCWDWPWEDHCHNYQDKDGPLGTVTWESKDDN